MAGLLCGIRVLIVEDAEDNRVVLEESPRFQGAGVEAVATAAEAADVLDRFDIVVADYDLPDHDGVWLLEQAMRLSQPIPVILLSGYAECQLEAIAKAPFARKLLKPVDPLDLGVEVLKALPTTRRLSDAAGAAGTHPLGPAQPSGLDGVSFIVESQTESPTPPAAPPATALAPTPSRPRSSAPARSRRRSPASARRRTP